MNTTAFKLAEQRYYPTDPVRMADSYSGYVKVREADPLCWIAPAAFGITRYGDIIKFVKDPRLAVKNANVDLHLEGSNTFQ